MVLITFEEAAARLDTPRETIEQWVEHGLLTVHQRAESSQLRPGSLGLSRAEQCLDEEELLGVAETMGWLYLSQQDWDDDKGD